MSAVAEATPSRSSGDPIRTSAVRPPLGVTSNFDDPPDAGHDIAFQVSVVCSVLIFSLFLVRSYVKVAILRQVTAEDVTYYISIIFMAAFFVVTHIMLAKGAGHHAWDLTSHQYQVLMKVCWAWATC